MKRLDPDVARLLPRIDDLLLTMGQAPLDVNALRAIFGKVLDLLHPQPPVPFEGRVQDSTVFSAAGDVPVRVYAPAGQTSDDTVIFLHGGGWVLGSCDSADRTCRALAEQLKLNVVSVDYRLAPEHPYPAALDDVMAVVGEVAARRPGGWLGLAGDSAGANLAAAAAIRAHHEDLQVDAQLLIYPALDAACSTASFVDLGVGYGLTADAVHFYWDAYVGAADRTNPFISPAQAADLGAFPPTIVTTAGFDPLRDEGEAFAARLVSSGVPTVYLPAPTLVHGWLDMGHHVPAALTARDRAFASLQVLRGMSRSTRPAPGPDPVRGQE